ncbi:MAG: AI-2E family transporter [Verrucomicrobiaceae bacterium]|nr:AI-2E family transporter [Verrucomicrobiaceae bacterium]
MKNLPTAFQRNALWTAITALSLTTVGAIAIGLIYLVTRLIAFLQPILIPFAVAGVLAYLLDPAVRWIEKRGLSRQKAVLVVFAAFTLALAGVALWVIPTLSRQTANLAKKVPSYTVKARNAVTGWALDVEKKYGVALLPHLPETKTGDTNETKTTPDAAGTSKTPDTPPAPATPDSAAAAHPESATDTDAMQSTAAADRAQAGASTGDADFDLQQFLTGDWVRTSLPAVLKNAWSFVKTSVGGFMGVFGFMLSFIIVPLYLFYFLIESAKIKETWAHYLPLRASAFKDEVVSCLTEINGYLIAFFRGQLFVSMINGIATGIGLMVVGLDFGLLIGLMLCLLGIIPYLGIAVCWIPAVVIASVQGASTFFTADSPWWALPLVVSGIFAIVQQIDGLFITPKVVGESVGLHPMTVIVSVFLWALILGGLLGAILAVPMTASIKVLFQRYIWRARIAPQMAGDAEVATKPAKPAAGA